MCGYLHRWLYWREHGFLFAPFYYYLLLLSRRKVIGRLGVLFFSFLCRPVVKHETKHPSPVRTIIIILYTYIIYYIVVVKISRSSAAADAAA